MLSICLTPYARNERTLHRFPEDMKWAAPYDPTGVCARFDSRGGANAAEAVVLVVLVVICSCRRGVSIIPLIAAGIGGGPTFSILYLLGFR